MRISVKSLVQIAFYTLIISALVVINLNQLSLTQADQDNPISAPITSPEVTPAPTPTPETTPQPTNPPSNNNGGSNNSGGSSGGSSNGGGAPSCNDQKPGTPILLAVTKNKPNQVILTWSKPVGPVTSYVLAYGLTPNKMLFGVPNTGNVNRFIVNQLNPRSTYYFQVRAANGCAPGEFSNVLGINGSGKVLGAKAVNTKPAINATTKVKADVVPKAANQPQPVPTPVNEQVQGVSTTKAPEPKPSNFFDNLIYQVIRFLYR